MIKGPTEPTKEQALASFLAAHPDLKPKTVRDLTGWYAYLPEPDPIKPNVAKFPYMTVEEMLLRK